MISVPYAVELPLLPQPKTVTTVAVTDNFGVKIAIAKEAREAGAYIRRKL